MDSRLIYESGKMYLNKMDWLNSLNKSENEWVYLNFEENINEKIIHEVISEHLKSENLFVVISRHQSFETKMLNVTSKIKEFLRTDNFSIWNQNFDKVIEFNILGIYRKGIKASH